MSIVPPNLPDERTAQRLLDLLAQLEHTTKNLRPAAPTPLADNTELTQLKSENAQLRRRQQQAREKLNALATKLEQSPDTQEEAA